MASSLGLSPLAGQGQRPAQLALKLLRTLPRVLTARHRVMVLADSGFCSTEFVEGVRRLGHHAVVGVRRDRRLSDGTRLDRAATYGKAVYLEGLMVPVYVASYLLGRDGTKEKRFVICTKALSPEHIVRWGKKRWSIEGFFKTAKGRFSLERFGQGTRLGVYRYLLLSLLAYLLAHWGHLSQGGEGMPRWGEAAWKMLEKVLPQTVIEKGSPVLGSFHERGESVYEPSSGHQPLAILVGCEQCSLPSPCVEGGCEQTVGP